MKTIIEAILNKKTSSTQDLKNHLLKDMFYGREPNFNLEAIRFSEDTMILDCDKLDIGTYDNCYKIYPTNLNEIIDNFGVKEIEIYNRDPKISVRWEMIDGSYSNCVDLSKVKLYYYGKSPLLLNGVEKIGKWDGNICFNHLKKDQYINLEKGKPIKTNILLDLKDYKFPILANLSYELNTSTPIKVFTNIMKEVSGIPDGFMFYFKININNTDRYDAYFIKGIQNPKEIDNYYESDFIYFRKLKGSNFKKLPNYKDVYYWAWKL